MDINNINMFADSMSPEETEKKIRTYLSEVLPRNVYKTWVDKLVFEKIESDCIVAVYCGNESLKEFESNIKGRLERHIRRATGKNYSLRVSKKSEGFTTSNPTMKKNIKVAKFLAISGIFVCFAMCIALITYSYICNRNFRETFYSVSNLKNDNKIRIVQLSDLHNARYGKDNEKLIERVEKLNPDIIVCTGDMVDSRLDRDDEVVSLCESLAEIAPAYYVYGNNEIEKVYGYALSEDVLDEKFGFNDENRDASALYAIEEEFEAKLEEAGIKVLKNEIDTVTVGTTNIDIFGVLTSNPSSFFSYGGAQYEEFISTNPDNLKITAIHEPTLYEEFKLETWGDLILCGHTQGGTVRVPMLGPLYTHEGGIFPERNDCFVYGRYEASGTPIIVSSGLENHTLLRINNQPELVIVDINKF